MKFKDITEARHHADAEYYRCPDCRGDGGFMVHDGPDDWDMEQCTLCSGKGRVSKSAALDLTKHSLYKRSEFVPIREARYSQDQTKQVTGELNLDDRDDDEYLHEENVVITVNMLDEDAVPGDTNAAVMDVRTTTGQQSWLANKIGIKQGDPCWYLHDNRGEMVAGWWGKSPWSIEPEQNSVKVR